MNNDIVLEAQELSIGYKGKGSADKVLYQDLSFKLRRGDFVSLLGPNGVGKSTLLRTLSGTQHLLSGNLYINGKNLKNCNERERSKLVGVVFTDKTQTGGLTVSELVELGRQPYTGFLGRLSSYDKQRVKEAINAVGVAHKANSYMAELSDGERQKVMIAKAIVQECPLILLDEPTAFLDVVSRIEIMSLLRNIAISENRTILLSSHDIDQSLVVSDKLLLLKRKEDLQRKEDFECKENSKGKEAFKWQKDFSFGITEDIILNGDLNDLFFSDSVAFDTIHGVYYPKVKWSKKVVVKTSSELLQHWMVNFLNRKGYACYGSLEEAGDNCSFVISIEEKGCIALQNINTHELVNCSSFEEVVKVME